MTVRVLPLLMLGAVLALLPACGEASAPAASPKVAVLCVDGVTFTVLDGLLASGRAPHMAALIKRGSRSVLESFPENDSKSPVLWATVATSTPPSVHGITSFSKVEKDADGNKRVRLLSARDRKVPALWNMVTTRGGTVGVIGYWNTWPAEAVDGYVVSDHFGYTKLMADHHVETAKGLTRPADLAAELGPLVAAPDDLDRGEVERLARFSDDEWDTLMNLGRDGEPVVGNGLVAFKYGYQSTATMGALTLHLLETRPQPDLLVTFLELPDRVGHHFWHAYRPDESRRPVPDEWVERWGDLIPEAYTWVDGWVGRIVERLDPDTTILVISDHGMQATGHYFGTPGQLERVGHSGTHHRDGILIAAGPAIEPGATARATLYDIAPTVLAAMGLPSSEQFDGRVLKELLDEAFLDTWPLQAPRSDALTAGADPAGSEGLDEDALDRLRSFGYIDETGTEVDPGALPEDG